MMNAVSKDAVDRLIEVLRDLVKDGKLKERDFAEKAIAAKLARGVASPSDDEYDFLVATIFVPDEDVGKGG
jgi:hypothetical protein